jgi:hypothetical protein
MGVNSTFARRMRKFYMCLLWLSHLRQLSSGVESCVLVEPSWAFAVSLPLARVHAYVSAIVVVATVIVVVIQPR